jgi:glycosyltransferase involved in cell wall biosynthesis
MAGHTEGISARSAKRFPLSSDGGASTDTPKPEIKLHGPVENDRLQKVSYGVSPQFRPVRLNGGTYNYEIREPFLLQVGSSISRKRVDVLLEVMVRLAPHHPDLKLVKVGGEWAPEHESIIRRGKIGHRIIHLCEHQSTEALADLYRRASVVLIPSSAEGFGLPVIEALASSQQTFPFSAKLPRTRLCLVHWDFMTCGLTR